MINKWKKYLRAVEIMYFLIKKKTRFGLTNINLEQNKKRLLILSYILKNPRILL